MNFSDTETGEILIDELQSKILSLIGVEELVFDKSRGMFLSILVCDKTEV